MQEYVHDLLPAEIDAIFSRPPSTKLLNPASPEYDQLKVVAQFSTCGEAADEDDEDDETDREDELDEESLNELELDEEDQYELDEDESLDDEEDERLDDDREDDESE
jgi:hypothetical protein